MAAKLDRTRAFATITGILEEELTGACFWQDGKHFTASGDELNPEPEPEVLEPEPEVLEPEPEVLEPEPEVLEPEPEPEPEVPEVVPVVKAVEKPKAKSKDTSDLDLL